MIHSSRPQSISWFQEQYKAGRLALKPPFQRKPVWSGKQRCALIESILLNIPIPEIYVQITQNGDGDSEEFGVVDGQQRLRTILQFIGIESAEDQEDGDDHNGFALDELAPNATHLGKTFDDIKGDARKAFFRYEICVRNIYTDNQRDVEDVFKRLNKFLLPLKPQELRNATFHGAFPKLAESLADNDYWAVNRIISPASIRRMADIEMMSDLLIGLIHGPQGGSAKIIDEYYEQFEQYEDEFPEQTRVTRTFARCLDAIEKLFPNIANAPRWGNRADFYSLFVALGTLLNEQELPVSQVKKLHDTLVSFAHEVDQRLEKVTAKVSADARTYTRAIEKGSNDRARRLDRHEVLVELIEPFLKERK